MPARAGRGAPGSRLGGGGRAGGGQEPPGAPGHSPGMGGDSPAAILPGALAVEDKEDFKRCFYRVFSFLLSLNPGDPQLSHSAVPQSLLQAGAQPPLPVPVLAIRAKARLVSLAAELVM